jgi:flagellar assembly protein FliH
MNTSPSVLFDAVIRMPAVALEYRDLAGDQGTVTEAVRVSVPEPKEPEKRAEVEMTFQELTERLQRERNDAASQTEQRLRQEYELKLQNERNAIAASLKSFEAERIDYYARVEAEVVQLALSIAAKILHREAQVDPMLLASLVRIAVERIGESSKVAVRVHPRRAEAWRKHFAGRADSARVEVKEDAALSELDCFIETEVGVSNFGLDSQLKEVEQGFFDLLALKPERR